ncbi:hypothetical protein D3C81_1812820 [compost metagenome]
MIVGAGGFQVAGGALDLLVQAECTTGAVCQFVAQLVHRGHHLLQGRHQLGLHATVAPHVQHLGQAVDGGG